MALFSAPKTAKIRAGLLKLLAIKWVAMFNLTYVVVLSWQITNEFQRVDLHGDELTATPDSHGGRDSIQGSVGKNVT